MLEGMVRTEVNLERPSFEKRLAKAVDKAGAKLAAPIKKTILNVMSERDEMAEVCVDAEGNPEPDPELRDYENVPLKEDIYTYLEREVKPHVDWVKSEGTFRWDPSYSEFERAFVAVQARERKRKTQGKERAK